MWAFLHNEQNRKVLAWLGGGFVAIASGLWAVFVYYDRNDSGTDTAPANCSVTAESSVAACGDVTSDNIIIGDD